MTPSPSDVRRLLDEVLRTESDFEAFCMDGFPEVSRRFSAGMDRVAKVNLLLQLCEHAEVLSRLRTADLDAVKRAIPARTSPPSRPVSGHVASIGPTTPRSSIVPAGPAGERRLTIRIQRTDEGLLHVSYLVPVFGQLAEAAPFDLATLAGKIQHEGHSGIAALNRLLDRGDEADIQQFLTGARVTGEDGVGSLLFRLLFPEQAAQRTVLGHLFGVEPEAATSPVRYGVHVRIWTDEPDLTGLPWRLTAYHGHLLSDSGWTFAVSPDAIRAQHVDLPALCRILVLAPEVRSLPALGSQAHIEDLRAQLRSAMPQQATDDFFHVVQNRAELDRAFGGQSFDVIYYYGHGCLHLDQACLRLGDTLSLDDLLTIADLKQMMRGHFPHLLLLNGCLTGAAGWHSAGHLLTPEVPVVVCSRTIAFAHFAGALGIRWLKSCLIERRDPVEALHQRSPLDPAESQHDFQWATHTIHASYSTWQPAQVLVRRLDARNPLRLDRTAPRAQAAEQVAALIESRSRRVEALLAYAGEGNLLGRFSEQAVEHIVRRKVAPILSQRVEFPMVRSDLKRRLAEALRKAVADEREPLTHALRRCAPRVRTDRIPVLWLNFGVCGDGNQEKLKPEELWTWLKFCCEELCLHCPDDIRIVCYLALQTEPSKHERLRSLVEGYEDKLNSDRFRVYLLPALPKVKRHEFKEYISEPDNTNCPNNSSVIETATELVFKDTDGHYEQVHAHIVWAEQNGWITLIEMLTQKHGPAAPQTKEEEPL